MAVCTETVPGIKGGFMKHTHRYLKLTASVAAIAMLFAGTALGANEGGPGMAGGQPVPVLQTGGVILPRQRSGDREDGSKGW